MVKFCTEKNKNKSKEDELLNVSNCQIALDETYKILDQGGFEPFIISGTLLGMAREGKIFAHDKDFDLGILGWEAQFDIFSLLFKTNKYELNIHELKGSQTYTLTARHIQTLPTPLPSRRSPQGDQRADIHRHRAQILPSQVQVPGRVPVPHHDE